MRQVSRFAGLVLVGALVASCGGGAASQVEHTSGGQMIVNDMGDIPADARSTVAEFDETVTAFEASQGGECVDACRHGARVCELAERICELAERHPESTAMAERCTDGRRRCEGARQTLARCGCDGI